MLLAKGKVIYFNRAELAVDYFSTINYKCPELSNPADYFMAIMSIESIETEDKEQEEQELHISKMYEDRIQMFSDSYQASNLKNNCKEVSKAVRPLKVDD